MTITPTHWAFKNSPWVGSIPRSELSTYQPIVDDLTAVPSGPAQYTLVSITKALFDSVLERDVV